jgi:hypothetical protein
MRHWDIALALNASAAISPASGQIAQPRVTGAGAATREAFVRRAGSGGLSDPASLRWVLGYLSGHVAVSDIAHRPFAEPEGIALDLLAYCRAHPARQLDGAAANFFERNRRCHAVRGCR